MKKLAKVFLILFTISTVFTSCRETTGDKVEDAVEDVADDVEDAVD
ncbi:MULTISPECIES: hypothetical protein [Flavobacteriaceae]|uniref:Uncharacterized protein n=1 Tax=Hwangdonia lutea TaxID=3075823 RepID=A0AA97HSD6_9FLAO|nr:MULTISPECIES: hypothetical protein [Flavobacteriaceae]WOD44388.1 hypothetical protein RNZ46_03805 [Hwangdonia sp. SCSIO 19198]